MDEVSPRCTDIPNVWSNGMEYAFDTERYLDNAAVPASTEEALPETLSQ